ncbi:hypothetical protein OA93_04585 [Flavobacterium sp. KMS]|uniref:hypothetical protein n=1 Tax=Flavobacterium sp. KMS TaxID=1566023 RepID=UPI000580569D|nr:hypothetical protein [Flavobacterium sp. KMS]KIA99447.1 hypothetical protein OA93_04585 [Flavobacterium sp. KMS]
MNEFLNRITAQREVINIINQEKKLSFPLVGLSLKSIERWKKENSISDDSEISKIINLIASKLFFLANKSQEQITGEYKLLSKNVSELINHLKNNITNWL